MVADDEFPDRDELEKFIKAHAESQGMDASKLKLNFDMTEEMLVFGLAGGFLHNLNYVDDPVFLEAANATLGTHQDGQPVPQEDLINSKIPMTLTGYALLDGKGGLIGFSCFSSQLDSKN